MAKKTPGDQQVWTRNPQVAVRITIPTPQSEEYP